jgi:glycosyltransferase involved in cell wall biosynthesis
MRLLFVTTNKHLPELFGGMEVNTHDLCLALIARGTSVGVLCGLAGVGLTGLRARLRRKLLRDPCPMDRGLGYPTWRSYDSISHVGCIAAAFEPDALIVQGAHDFVPLVTTCLGLQLPVLCYLHTQDRLLLPTEILEHLNLSFIANSGFTRLMHPEKTFLGVVPPLVPSPNYVTTGSRSLAVFVNPGPHKGLDIVLRLAQARPDVKFLFVVNRKGFGRSGPQRPPWHSLRNVKIVGPVGDMRKVYRRAKLVIAPSQWIETWGRIATEAHFSGIPVLASDSGGLPEAVGPGGICVPRKAGFPVWLDAFSAIWDDATRYQQLSEAAVRYSRRREISPDTIVASFLTLVGSCIQHKGQTAAGAVIEPGPG